MKTNINSFNGIPGYHLVEQLYTGSKTLVYRAIRQRDSHPVVIKFLERDYPSFNEILHFRNQYTITKNLRLSGIIEPYSLEVYGNSYALVMEDFGGISLKEYIKIARIELNDFLRIGLCLSDILYELYQNRVIHKDIKPANILINPQTKQIKLIDFSIASLLPKETQEISHPNILEGTLAYISPEQTGRMNRGIDYRTDFYSLGITFYELLANELPFRCNDPMELIHSHIAKHPQSLQEKNPEIPAIISQIVMKLMAKNAEDRYQSALGLKYDLERCLQQWQTLGKIEPFPLGQYDFSDRFLIPEKLYGREAEVQKLLNAFDRVAAGTSEFMLVAGFSGIGKTAIIHEVHKPIAQKHSYFIKGKFDQFNRNIPFFAFVQAFRDLMEQLLSETDEQLQNWKTKVLEALGDNGQVIIEVIPELEQIIGQQSPAPELPGTAAQNRFNLLFQKFISVFTTPEHPLVIFLDDLQWADSASLKLIELLMDRSQPGHLLLIGAYRDNEVLPGHPLILTLETLKNQGTTLNTIHLMPLSQISLNQLIADTLNCPAKLAQPLTELVDQKTQGNPFFTTQFLKALHQDELITFKLPPSSLTHGEIEGQQAHLPEIQPRNSQSLLTKAEQGGWQCDITKIWKAALTEDVVAFMAQQLQKLPPDTQTILKLAACMGNSFELTPLAVVAEKPEAEVAVALWKALQEGLILPQSQVYKFYQDTALSEPQEGLSNTSTLRTVAYKFLHDRIQQAAYSLIPEAQKQTTHLRIGTLLSTKLSITEREERIFEIVNHLNIGRPLITQPLQVEELAQLNLVAGCKAKNSTAYGAAYNYIVAGIDLLPATCWESHYELSLALYKERAEIEYLTGNFEAAETCLEAAIAKARSPLEKAEIYNMSIVQYTLQAKYPEAIQAGREALALINIDLPETQLDEARAAELTLTQHLLQDRSFLAFAELPFMTQPQQKIAIKLLISMGPPTYRSHQRLWSVICAKAVNLCLQYGNTPEIGYIYPAFGGLRGYALNNYQNIEELIEITLQLIQAFNNKSAESVAYLMIGSSLRHWSHSLKVATEDYLASYRVGLESSNLQYAAYAFGHNMYCRFYQSVHLEKLFQEISESLKFSQKHKNQWAIDLLRGGQRILLEYREPEENSVPEIERLSEAEYLAQCRTHKNWQVICIYNILKTQLLFCQEQLLEALESGKKADVEIINVAPQGLLAYAHHLFIYSLVLSAVYPQLSGTEQLAYWEKISTYQQQLESWAQNCPDNFLHLSCLVKAEIARISGNLPEAIALYDQAITVAKTQECLQEEAMANELAAKFYLGWGKEKVAAGYLQEAYYGYARWGAKAKTKQLELTYPQLLYPILQHQEFNLNSLEAINPLSLSSISSFTQTSSTSVSDTLDFTSVFQAAQTISSSIDLDELVTRLTRIILENSGAKKSVLILPEKDSWQVKAITWVHSVANSEEQVETCLMAQPVEICQEIPQTIICYVKNTQQPVFIESLKTSLPVLRDEYLLIHQPQSLFCCPILYQGNLVGILDLENRQMHSVFTKKRHQIINLLASQIGISLENARLYQQSQQALKDLQQAQLQMIQSEKMSALGNLVAGVAHEINNPVGFIAGNIPIALDYIQDLFKVISLYQQEYTQPSAILEEELKILELDYLQEDLPKLIESMNLGINRIREISTSLRNFSRADQAYKVPYNIHEGLESTLLILKHRLKAQGERPAIEVVTEYGNLPPVLCFPGQLNQVFINILANAIDALEEANQGKSYAEIQGKRNQITIRTSFYESQFIQIEIADNGIGMSEAVKQHIFESLFTTKAVGKGTGLGLAIAHQIVVEKHGGTIDVHSIPGQGTKFMIKLPV